MVLVTWAYLHYWTGFGLFVARNVTSSPEVAQIKQLIFNCYNGIPFKQLFFCMLPVLNKIIYYVANFNQCMLCYYTRKFNRENEALDPPVNLHLIEHTV